jgi:hypothetical protein
MYINFKGWDIKQNTKKTWANLYAPNNNIKKGDKENG